MRAKITPARVIVGQPATLQIDVLAPNYMTSPPVMPDFQIRNAVTMQTSRLNTTEQIDGTSYAGISFEFKIFPQEAGSFTIAGQKIAVTYAAEPPATRNATLDLPSLSFEALIPDAASSLDPFISASGLTLEQNVQRSAEPLKVGDAVTRTITLKANGTPAMLLPPAAFPRIDGTAVYPAQPSLDDKSDSRTGDLTGTRTDQATYMLEKPGNYTLPAVEVAWWDPGANKIVRARAESVTLQVAPNPAMQSGTTSAGQQAGFDWDNAIDWLIARWPWVLALIFALGVLIWLLPGIVRRLRQKMRQRRAAYLASEACSFDQLRAASCTGDLGRFYNALLAWLVRFAPAAPAHSVRSFERAANDPRLNEAIASIEQRLYGQAEGGLAWTSQQAMRQVKRARRRLISPRHRHSTPLVQDDINPTSASARFTV